MTAEKPDWIGRKNAADIARYAGLTLRGDGLVEGPDWAHVAAKVMASVGSRKKDAIQWSMSRWTMHFTLPDLMTELQRVLPRAQWEVRLWGASSGSRVFGYGLSINPTNHVSSAAHALLEDRQESLQATIERVQCLSCVEVTLHQHLGVLLSLETGRGAVHCEHHTHAALTSEDPTYIAGRVRAHLHALTDALNRLRFTLDANAAPWSAPAPEPPR